MTGEPLYKETFSVKRDPEYAEARRAEIEAAIERIGNLELVEIKMLPTRGSRTKIETTVIGMSRDLNLLREAVQGDTDLVSSGGDLTDLALELVATVTADPVRRAYWERKRRKRGPVEDEATSPNRQSVGDG